MPAKRLKNIRKSNLYWDEQVLGGTINCGKECLEVKTIALAADSHVARMAAQVDLVRPMVWSGVRLRTIKAGCMTLFANHIAVHKVYITCSVLQLLRHSLRRTLKRM